MEAEKIQIIKIRVQDMKNMMAYVTPLKEEEKKLPTSTKKCNTIKAELMRDLTV